MYLKTLSVVNYKNIRDSALEFSPKLNTFIGNNGAGKTNLLDAIYSLSFSKSFFNVSDQWNVTHNESWFMLHGIYEREGNEESLMYAFQSGKKKQMKRNGRLYRRLSEHIGLFPLVMVSPADNGLVTGGGEERRKFIDGVISQYDSAYLNDLLRYNRILTQRNNLLKQAYPGKQPDPEMIEVYDRHLSDYGEKIYIKREEFVKNLVPVFQHYYTLISGGREKVGLLYKSDLKGNDLMDLLRDSFLTDKNIQFTSKGIHKDDLILNFDRYLLKKTGSQGQQKTYLVALKLAQFDFIHRLSGIKPVLLLDDIFDKLDRNRVEEIVKMVAGDKFGQIFITDTNREHLESIIHQLAPDYRIFTVMEGHIETAL